MRVLIACEESQAVCKAFRELGHEAYSNDLIPCSGTNSEWHLQKNARTEVMYSNLKTGLKTSSFKNSDRYDLVISFPPCTDLAVSGARWFINKRLSGEQEKSIEFFLDIWYFSHATENPIGIMNNGQYIKKWFPHLFQKAMDMKFPFKPSQIIQPWQFGHGETKSTCLWLQDLPLLNPTNIVEGREQRVWKLPPSKDRAKLRSKTYQGIADAMANQWGGNIL